MKIKLVELAGFGGTEHFFKAEQHFQPNFLLPWKGWVYLLFLLLLLLINLFNVINEECEFYYKNWCYLSTFKIKYSN